MTPNRFTFGPDTPEKTLADVYRERLLDSVYDTNANMRCQNIRDLALTQPYVTTEQFLSLIEDLHFPISTDPYAYIRRAWFMRLLEWYRSCDKINKHESLRSKLEDIIIRDPIWSTSDLVVYKGNAIEFLRNVYNTTVLEICKTSECYDKLFHVFLMIIKLEYERKHSLTSVDVSVIEGLLHQAEYMFKHKGLNSDDFFDYLIKLIDNAFLFWNNNEHIKNFIFKVCCILNDNIEMNVNQSKLFVRYIYDKTIKMESDGFSLFSFSGLLRYLESIKLIPVDLGYYFGLGVSEKANLAYKMGNFECQKLEL